jgi:hypothetical protein
MQIGYSQFSSSAHPSNQPGKSSPSTPVLRFVKNLVSFATKPHTEISVAETFT